VRPPVGDVSLHDKLVVELWDDEVADYRRWEITIHDMIPLLSPTMSERVFAELVAYFASGDGVVPLPRNST
jgi:hypothetical protein